MSTQILLRAIPALLVSLTVLAVVAWMATTITGSESLFTASSAVSGR